MIQQIINVVNLTGVFITYCLSKLYKQRRIQYTYQEIEITDYEYVDLWSDI
jgi:hypothetical protein